MSLLLLTDETIDAALVFFFFCQQEAPTWCSTLLGGQKCWQLLWTGFFNSWGFTVLYVASAS